MTALPHEFLFTKDHMVGAAFSKLDTVHWRTSLQCIYVTLKHKYMKKEVNKVTDADKQALPEEIGVVYKIPVSELKPHPLNPYHVRDDEAMQELSASIQKHGVLVPIIARKQGDGFELIAGHRRQHAAELIGLDTVPVLVLDLDDDDAIIQLVDSNIQREDVLPSERAWAYKLRMDAMKHKAGRPTKENEEN